MTHAYAVTNKVTGLSATAFTSSSGPSDSTRAALNDGRMDRIFTCTSASGGVTIVIDLGSALSIAGWAVLNSNIATASGTPTLRVRGADDSAITTNVASAKAASTLNTSAPKHKDHVLQFAATTRRYWELTWTWTGNFALSIGELFAYATPTTLTRKAVYGSGEGEFYKLARVDLANGEPRAVLLNGPVRRLALKWKDHSASEIAELRTMWRATRGPVTPFLFIPSYEATATAAAASEQEVIYGRLLAEAFDFTQPDYNLYEPPDLVVSSLGREAGS